MGVAVVVLGCELLLGAEDSEGANDGGGDSDGAEEEDGVDDGAGGTVGLCDATDIIVIFPDLEEEGALPAFAPVSVYPSPTDAK